MGRSSEASEVFHRAMEEFATQNVLQRPSCIRFIFSLGFGGVANPRPDFYLFN